METRSPIAGRGGKKRKSNIIVLKSKHERAMADPLWSEILSLVRFVASTV